MCYQTFNHLTSDEICYTDSDCPEGMACQGIFCGRVEENVTAADVEEIVTKADVDEIVTAEDAEENVTAADVKEIVTKADVEENVTAAEETVTERMETDNAQAGIYIYLFFCLLFLISLHMFFCRGY